MVWKPTRAVTVTGPDGAFVQMVPDPLQRVTAGIDAMPLAPVVGQKWFTWTPAHDAECFRWDLGPARPFAPSIQVLCFHACCALPQLTAITTAPAGHPQERLYQGRDVSKPHCWRRRQLRRQCTGPLLSRRACQACGRGHSGTSGSMRSTSCFLLPHGESQAVLSLLAAGGGCGIPYAHVLSYQADMALLVEAAKVIAQACQEGSQVAFTASE